MEYFEVTVGMLTKKCNTYSECVEFMQRMWEPGLVWSIHHYKDGTLVY